jgi:ferredoxin-NADP reductase
LPAIWWIGNPHMLVLTLIFGLMILRKLHRFQLFFVFLVASLILTSIIGVGHHISLSTSLETAFKSSPLIFLGTVMLTEPTTIPPGKRQQGVYGAIVGLIFTCQLSLGPVSATPELALVLGNLYTFAVSPKYKLKLKYKSFTKLAPHIYDISFASDTKIMFKPGQYMDWTLAHKSDSRGNRRTFSIASAPGDSNLHIVMRFQDKASSFKNKLIELTDGDSITVGQLSGNFVMPDDKSKKLLFVAGGIGVTPFISMVSYLVKNDQKRDIVMFYMVSNEAEFCFKDLWQQAAGLGIKVVPVLTNGEPSQLWNGLNGRLSESMLTQYVPAYKERRCYISGPNGFVTSYKSLLKKLGIKQQSIVSDYFSGY